MSPVPGRDLAAQSTWIPTQPGWSMYYLKTLGDLSLRREDPDGPEAVGSSRGVAALAYLATTAGHTVPRRRLARLLWPRSSLRRSRRQLRQALYYVRTRTDTVLVAQNRDPLALAGGRIDVDVWRFTEAVKSNEFGQAVRYHEGSFLETFESTTSREFESWREAQNAKLEAMAKAAYQEIVALRLDDGHLNEAIRHARAWVELDLFDPTAQATLIRALLRADDWVAASAAYERYRTLLRRELGESPEPGLADRIAKARRRIS